MDEWKDIFSFDKSEEVSLVTQWLESNLRKPHRFEVGRRTITIISPSKDESFQCGQWVRYQNPLGRHLLYTVFGRDEQGRILYRSKCKKCRDPDVQEPHYLHARRDL